MEISNMKALLYFNINGETTLQTDTSKKGLGACLIQKGKIVCYASRALTKTEQNYQNLEREALGTIWGMHKFHYFHTSLLMLSIRKGKTFQLLMHSVE